MYLDTDKVNKAKVQNKEVHLRSSIKNLSSSISHQPSAISKSFNINILCVMPMWLSSAAASPPTIDDN